MKSAIIVLLILTFFTDRPLIAGESKKTNEYVGVAFTVTLKQQNAGTAGELLITFKPKEDIHINLEPPISVTFDSAGGVTPAGSIEAAKSKEYLDVTKPVKQKFKFRGKVKAGTATIKGVLSYFYCSGTDGWCSRFKQPFEIKATTR